MTLTAVYNAQEIKTKTQRDAYDHTTDLVERDPKDRSIDHFHYDIK